MIKGVNKNIIEIANTGSDVFDRAILFVNAEHSKASTADLKRQANMYLSGIARQKTASKSEIKKLRFQKKIIRLICGSVIIASLILTAFFIARTF